MKHKPSSARSPDKTSVASGIPKGSNDPIIIFDLRPRRIILTMTELYQSFSL